MRTGENQSDGRFILQADEIISCVFCDSVEIQLDCSCHGLTVPTLRPSDSLRVLKFGRVQLTERSDFDPSKTCVELNEFVNKLQALVYFHERVPLK